MIKFTLPSFIKVLNPDGKLSVPWLQFFTQLLDYLNNLTGSGGPVTGIGSTTLSIAGTSAVPTVNLTSEQLTDIENGGTSLQPITGLSGSYTYSSLTIDAAGQIVAVGSGAIPSVPTSANPSALIGLTVVNGTASTWLRSDSAPALDQSIAPTWTGQHNFTGSAAVTTTTSSTSLGVVSGAPRVRWSNSSGAVDAKVWDTSTDATTYHLRLINDAQNTAKDYLAVTRIGAVVSGIIYGNSTDKPPHQFFGPLAVNGNTPPAQSTGWGTPTGGAVVANYNGSLATLLQTSNALAQLITVLKQVGILGA